MLVAGLGFLNDEVVVVSSFFDDRDGNEDGKVSIPERVAFLLSPPPAPSGTCRRPDLGVPKIALGGMSSVDGRQSSAIAGVPETSVSSSCRLMADDW
jgi:hypothetical protein